MAKDAKKEGRKETRTEAAVPVKAAPAVPSVWREFDAFDRMMDRFLEDFPRMTLPGLLGRERWWPMRELRLGVPAVDVYEEKDAVVVKAELPGMEKDDIEVTLTGTTLTLKGEKKKEEEVKERDFYRCERSYGSFSRIIPLPADVKPDLVKATFNNGVLEVRLPKTDEAKKRSVKVEVR